MLKKFFAKNVLIFLLINCLLLGFMQATSQANPADNTNIVDGVADSATQSLGNETGQQNVEQAQVPENIDETGVGVTLPNNAKQVTDAQIQEDFKRLARTFKFAAGGLVPEENISWLYNNLVRDTDFVTSSARVADRRAVYTALVAAWYGNRSPADGRLMFFRDHYTRMPAAEQRNLQMYMFASHLFEGNNLNSPRLIAPQIVAEPPELLPSQLTNMNDIPSYNAVNGVSGAMIHATLGSCEAECVAGFPNPDVLPLSEPLYLTRLDFHAPIGGEELDGIYIDDTRILLPPIHSGFNFTQTQYYVALNQETGFADYSRDRPLYTHMNIYSLASHREMYFNTERTRNVLNNRHNLVVTNGTRLIDADASVSPTSHEEVMNPDQAGNTEILFCPPSSSSRLQRRDVSAVGAQRCVQLEALQKAWANPVKVEVPNLVSDKFGLPDGNVFFGTDLLGGKFLSSKFGEIGLEDKKDLDANWFVSYDKAHDAYKIVSGFDSSQVLSVINNQVTFAEDENKVSQRWILDKATTKNQVSIVSKANSKHSLYHENNEIKLGDSSSAWSLEFAKRDMLDKQTLHIVPSQDNRFAVDVNNTNNHAIFNNFDANSGTQNWLFDYNKDLDSYNITTQTSNGKKALTASGANGNIELADVNKDNKNQNWLFIRDIATGQFVLANTEHIQTVLGSIKSPQQLDNMVGAPYKAGDANQHLMLQKTQTPKEPSLPPVDRSSLADGQMYVIKAMSSNNSVVDAAFDNSGIPKPGNNVHLMGEHDGNNQKWLAQYDKTRQAYRFINVANENMSLTWDESHFDGVIVSATEELDNQFWFVEKQTDGSFILVNYMDKNKVLDLDDPGYTNGNNINIYPRNGNETQKWQVEETNKFVDDVAHLNDKEVSFRSVVDRTKAIDIIANNDVIIYDAHEKDNQRFSFVADNNRKGFYRLKAANNQNYLTWDLASHLQNVVVKGFADNSYQLWKFEVQTDGSFIIINGGNPEAMLSLENGAIANNTNIQIKPKAANVTAQDKWYIAPIGGILQDDQQIRIAPSSQTRSVLGGIRKGDEKRVLGLNSAQLEPDNNEDTQSWVALYNKVSASYRFTNLATKGQGNDSRTLGWDTADSLVRLFKPNSNSDQFWVLDLLPNGSYTIASLQNQNKVLDMFRNSVPNFYQIPQLNDRDDRIYQKWNIAYRKESSLPPVDRSSLVDGQMYVIKAMLSNNSVVDAAFDNNGIPKPGNNVHLMVDVDGNNQKWLAQYDKTRQAYRFINVVDGQVSLTWDRSNAGGVIVSATEDLDNQFWFVEKQTDGSFILVNYMDKNKVLDLDDPGYTNGNNINIYPRNGNETQKWQVEETNKFVDDVAHLNDKEVSFRSVADRTKAVDVRTDDNDALVWDAKENLRQSFIFVPDDKHKGFYRLQNSGNNNYLTWDKNSNHVVAKPFVADSANSRYQLWRFEVQADGSFIISSKADKNKVFSAPHKVSESLVDLWVLPKVEDVSYKEQKWYVAPIGGVLQDGEPARIALSGQPRFVLEGFRNPDNTSVLAWNAAQVALDRNEDSQRWVTSYNKINASYSFTNFVTRDKGKDSRMLGWDPDSDSVANFVTMREPNSNSNQLWVVDLLPNGSYTVASLKHQKQVLDMFLIHKDRFYPIPKLNDRNGDIYQKWSITYPKK